MSRYWKPSRAMVSSEINQMRNDVAAMEQKKNSAIGLNKPEEYRNQVIAVAELLSVARFDRDYANEGKPAAGQAWASEMDLRSYQELKKQYQAEYSQYLEAKQNLINAWSYSEQEIINDIKAVFNCMWH